MRALVRACLPLVVALSALPAAAGQSAPDRADAADARSGLPVLAPGLTGPLPAGALALPVDGRPAPRPGDPLSRLVTSGALPTPAALLGALVAGSTGRPGTSAAASPVVVIGGGLPLGGAQPAGDLDGDGLDDVVAYRTGEDLLSLEARRGTDGALLWAVDAPAEVAALVPVGVDLTGDGSSDLLRVAGDSVLRTDERQGDCVDFCRIRYDVDVTQRLGVVEGRTGRTAWSQVGRGRTEYARDVVTTTTPSASDRSDTSTFRATGLLLPLVVHGARPALVLQSHEREERASSRRHSDTVAGVLTYRSSSDAETGLRSRTQTQLRRGATGVVTASRDSGWVEGSTLAYVTGDVTGDVTEDVVAVETIEPAVRTSCSRLVLEECSGTGSGSGSVRSARLAVRDGRDLSTVWERPLEGDPLAAFPVGGDLDGDGLGDLVVEDYGPTSLRTALVSGADGRDLWAATGNAYPLFPAQLDGGPGTDLLLAVLPSGDSPTAMTLERRDGRTGALLHRTEVAEPVLGPRDPSRPQSDFSWVLVTPSPGRDRDGLPAVVASAVAYRFTDQGDPEYRSEAFVEPIAAGTRTALYAGADEVFALGLPDVDGDARGEVLLERYGRGTVSRTVLGRGGAPLWGLDGGLLVEAGEQDGRPGAELLHADGRTVASLSGATGRPRWRA